MDSAAPRSRRVLWICGGLLALVGASTVWVVVGDRDPAPGPAAPPDPSVPARRPATTAPGARREAVPAALPAVPGAVATAVAEGRRAAEAEVARFRAEGWSFVEEAPPEAGLVALDPALLGQRERALRRQLETASLRPEQVPNAHRIAREAVEPRTRRAAIEALGHAAGEPAQAALRELFDEVRTEAERRQVLGLVRAASLSDPGAEWLLSRLGAGDVSDALKAQATFSLALAALAAPAAGQGDALDALLSRVPADWRGAVAESYRAVSSR